MRQLTRRELVAAIGTAAISPMLGVLPGRAATRHIVIATGGTGGVYYPYGRGLAKLLSKKMPHTQAAPQITGGSVDNIKLLANGRAAMGFATIDSAYDAFKGQDTYKDVGPQKIATLAVLYSSVLHVVASEASGIKTIAGIKGKRISVGSVGSATESAADRVMLAAGLDPKKDVTRANLGVKESSGALRDGNIDAFFWVGGVPTAAVKDLVSTSTNVTFIENGDLASALALKYPGVYRLSTLEKGAYDGLKADLPVLGVDDVLLVPEAMDSALVKEILAVIFDNLAEVAKIHPVAKLLSLESAAAKSAVPHHPAAVEFYRSRGIKG